jgi:hypothetical protein
LIIAYTSDKPPVEPPSQAEALKALFGSSGPESPTMEVDDLINQLLPSYSTLLPSANIVSSNNEGRDDTGEKDREMKDGGVEED